MALNSEIVFSTPLIPKPQIWGISSGNLGTDPTVLSPPEENFDCSVVNKTVVMSLQDCDTPHG